MKPMKFVCISDTHLRHNLTVPDGDVLIHSGDATNIGTIQEVAKFNNWLGTLPHTYKFFIPGNHDWLFETNEALARSTLSNAITLIDEGHTLPNGVHIYGAPWQPEFCNWAFNLPRGSELKAKWDLIDRCTDILVTHGPPVKIKDRTPRNTHVGCNDLFDAVLRVAPKYHIFGHIHGGYGKEFFNGTTFINASICDERYVATNEAIEFEL